MSRQEKKPKKLASSLVYKPFLLFIIVVLLLPTALYLYHDRFQLTSYHKEIVFNATDKKRQRFDSWFADNKKTVEKLSQSVMTEINLNELIAQKTVSSKSPSRSTEAKRQQEFEKLKRLFSEESYMEKFDPLSLISKDGVIIFSTSKELVNSSIAGTELFDKLISKEDKALLMGFWQDTTKTYEVDVVTPIKGEQSELLGFLHAVIKSSRLQELINEGSDRYITYSLVDQRGTILVSSGDTAMTTKKYNPELLNRLREIQYSDGYIINVVSLGELRLFLLQKSELLKVFRPLIELAAIYCLFVFFGFMLFVYQAISFKTKVARPLTRLVSHIKSSLAGVRSVIPQKDYALEIDIINRAVQDMIAELVVLRTPVKAIPQENDQAVETPKVPLNNQDNRTSLTTFLIRSSVTLRSSVLKDLSEVLDSNATTDLDRLYKLRRNIILLAFVLECYGLIRDKDPSQLAVEPIRVKELLDQIEPLVEVLKTGLSIDVVIDIDDTLFDLEVKANSDLFKPLIFAPIYNAFASTTDGTITVLCSKAIREDGSQCLEFYVSDTGSGYDHQELQDLSSGVNQSEPAITVAYMLSTVASVEFKVESVKQKGSVYRLTKELS